MNQIASLLGAIIIVSFIGILLKKSVFAKEKELRKLILSAASSAVVSTIVYFKINNKFTLIYLVAGIAAFFIMKEFDKKN